METSLALTSGIGDLIDPAHLLATFGMIGVLAIIFAETGLLIGFFFPGDSLLFLAGVAASPFAAQIPGIEGAQLNIWVLLICTPVCALLGAQLGHFLGARYGSRMFDRPNSRIFKRAYVEKAEHYFNKFGPAKAVVLARFIPIVRTFLNPVAGVLEMPARQFLIWNAVGAVLWTDGVLTVGYLLARQVSKIPNVDKYLLPFIALIVLISCIPIFVEIVRGRREHKRTGAHAASTGRAPDGGTGSALSAGHSPVSDPSVEFRASLAPDHPLAGKRADETVIIPRMAVDPGRHGRTE
ncbi:MAG TPA: VTT domain-containing protein [Rugosimonospora sp.]|nr:VTT domain-containing protein [Rugosimonospora sp.]